MKIIVDTDIKALEYWAVGHEVPKVTGSHAKKSPKEVLVETFKNPKLLTDPAAIAKLPSINRDAALRLLEFPERTVSYDGVDVSWSDIRYPGVWSPSIDTILFAKALKRVFKYRHYFRTLNSMLEIGAGSGYLSKFVIEKKIQSGRPLQHANLMDINADALRCAMDTLSHVSGKTAVSYTLNRPSGAIHVSHKYDLVISNPPYITRPSAREDNPFEGLFLYGEILARAHELMHRKSKLIINFSSISKKEVHKEFQKVFRIKILERMKVPLKIPLITAQLSPESKEWMAYLIKNKKLIVDESEKSGYKYWQIIEIAECVLKSPN